MLQPKTPNEYLAMQQSIRAASKALLPMLDREANPEEFQRVEFDAIASTVALMATQGEDANKKTTEQIHKFLRSRKQLLLPDISTGMQAAMLLELQPNKSPARKTYELLLELTEDDERPEILGLRFQIEGSIRRLDLLGKPLELKATSLAGKSIDISDYNGKYVLVNFFIRDSRSCEAVIPQLRKYSEKYADQLAVVAVAVDQDPKALAEYVKSSQFAWPVIHDNAANPSERLHHKYGVSAFPLVLLLNKVGEVVSLEAHSSELDRIMQMLFEAPTPAPVPKPSGAAATNDKS
ncbi:MAG: hypothetical protein Aurels2KO_24780 [Aureliella sp.]